MYNRFTFEGSPSCCGFTELSIDFFGNEGFREFEDDFLDALLGHADCPNIIYYAPADYGTIPYLKRIGFEEVYRGYRSSYDRIPLVCLIYDASPFYLIARELLDSI